MQGGGCLGQDGSQQLPLDGSGGGGEKTTRYTHTPTQTQSPGRNTQRADRRTNAHNWLRLATCKAPTVDCRPVCLPTRAFFGDVPLKSPGRTHSHAFQRRYTSQCPEGGEKNIPKIQGTLWVCSLFWAQEERGPFPAGWPMTSLNTLLLSMIPVRRGCSWSPREPQRFSGGPLGVQREVKVSRRAGGGGGGNSEIISSIVQNSERSTFLKTIPREGRFRFCTGWNTDRQLNQVTGSAATNQELL